MSVKATESGGTPRCSFCHKSQDDVAYLVASPTDDPRAYICDECVDVCHSIPSERCKPQTGFMPSDIHTNPPARWEAGLSNEAEDDVRERIRQIEAKALKKLREKRTHPWLDHPLAPQLLTVTEDWIKCDRRGQNTDHQLAEMKRLAAMMPIS